MFIACRRRETLAGMATNSRKFHAISQWKRIRANFHQNSQRKGTERRIILLITPNRGYFTRRNLMHLDAS